MRRYLLPVLALALFALPHSARGQTNIYKRVTLQRGELAFGAITGANLGAANSVLVATKDAVLVAIENTTDVELVVAYAGANFKRVPAGGFRVFDFRADEVALAAGTWAVYRAAGAPTSGNLEIVLFPAW